ncbi:MAG: ParA family protein [Pseudonocardia sp.]|nr:ParA family protein [Pseudonocardia sp.]
MELTVWDVLNEQQRADVSLEWTARRTVILAIDSEKGGVGKTALAGGLAGVAGEHGLPVLAIDLDPRATLTAELDAERTGDYTVNDLLYQDPSGPVTQLRGLAADAIRPAGIAWPRSVKVIAAERALAHRESDPTANLENRLKVALHGVADDFALILLDLPPRAGGKLVGAGLLAATHVIFPGTLNEDGYIGVRDAMHTVEVIRTTDPEPAEIVGVLRNVVDRETQLARTYDEKLRAEHGDLVMDVAVPRRVVREEARTACVPITAAGPTGRAVTNAYIHVLNRVGKAAA